MFRLLRGWALVRRLGFRNIVRIIRHLPGYMRLYVGLFKDSRTPRMAKALLIGVLLYIISPIDFLPDVLPFFGQMDDLALLAFGLSRFHEMTPTQLRQEHEVAAGLNKPIPVRVNRK